MRIAPGLVWIVVSAVMLATGCAKRAEPPPSGASDLPASAGNADVDRTLDDVVANAEAPAGLPVASDATGAEKDAAREQVNQGRRCFELGRRRDGRAPDEDKLQEAIGHYNEAVQLDPASAEAYCGRGDVSLGIGQTWIMEDIAKATRALQDAVADYTKAIELDADCLPAYLGRGSTHQALGDYGPAMADFEKALELDPGNEDARSRIEDLKDEMGLFE